MYKIGVIGEKGSVLGFMALGFSVYEADSAESADRLLRELVRSGEYAVILLSDRYAVLMTETLAKYKDMPLPAITVIPAQGGGNGYGMASIKSAVERAVGADILFKDSE